MKKYRLKTAAYSIKYPYISHSRLHMIYLFKYLNPELVLTTHNKYRIINGFLMSYTESFNGTSGTLTHAK